MPKTPATGLLPASAISHKIYFLRKTRVMIDSDLAVLYGVTTFNLNKAVLRNLRRFPKDFMFRVTSSESDSLIFQTGISKKKGRGGSRYLPYAFTEHGIAMLSSVLHSDRAVQVNIAIMRAFLQIRAMLATHEDLRRKIIGNGEALRLQIPRRFRHSSSNAGDPNSAKETDRISCPGPVRLMRDAFPKNIYK